MLANAPYAPLLSLVTCQGKTTSSDRSVQWNATQQGKRMKHTETVNLLNLTEVVRLKKARQKRLLH